MSTSALRILQLYQDCGPGGAEQMIFDLSRSLRHGGHHVTFVTCREGWLLDKMQKDGFDGFMIPQRRRFDLSTLSKILRLARERRFDIIHAHELPAMMGLAPAALLKGFPLVATLHGRENIGANKRRRLACRLAGLGCRTVIAVSQALQNFLVDNAGLPERKVSTIYNGIDLQKFRANSSADSLRRTLGIPDDARVIGTVGSLYHVKGQSYLLQAMAKVVQRIPKTVCLIAGRGELLSVLQQQANDLKLGDRVKLLGYRSDVADLLSLMEVFVLPSISEGLPLSLLEAQAMGKPVVASDVGGTSEVIEQGKTGFLVPPAQPEILADRVLRLLENPDEARSMGSHGRLRVRDGFSLEAMTQSYLSLYRRCLNGRIV